MKFRFRSLAALLALSALALLQVEALWASSACSLGMEMSVAGQTAEADTHPEDCLMGPAAQHHEHEGQGSQAPACPLMAAGAASCVGGAAVLPVSDEPTPGPVETDTAVASSDHAKDLLLAVSLLRPPQA